MRAHTCFTCLTFTDWSAFVGLGWLLGRFVCFAFAFFLFTDQPVRSSYQPMTILAYLHDCHCRYDERSIVQKKKDGWTLLLLWCSLTYQCVFCLKGTRVFENKGKDKGGQKGKGKGKGKDQKG